LNLSPIKKKRVYQQVIERIKESIEQGSIQAGNKLPSERELAAQLSVSRSVVREAMSVLNESGLLNIRPGIGVFLIEEEEPSLLHRINQILQKEQINLVELLEVREGLEGQAAFLAAQRGEEKDLKEIYSCLLRLEQAVKEGKIAAQEDFAFHMAVVRASRNESIVEILRLLSDRFLEGLNQSRSRSVQLTQKAMAVVKEHYGIYEAIAAGDPERARKKMLDHIQNVKQSYKER
jgi:GntR family transcriptional repressor for pyruvate dehydrogenase complex